MIFHRLLRQTKAILNLLVGKPVGDQESFQRELFHSRRRSALATRHDSRVFSLALHATRGFSETTRTRILLTPGGTSQGFDASVVTEFTLTLLLSLKAACARSRGCKPWRALVFIGKSSEFMELSRGAAVQIANSAGWTL